MVIAGFVCVGCILPTILVHVFSVIRGVHCHCTPLQDVRVVAGHVSVVGTGCVFG